MTGVLHAMVASSAPVDQYWANVVLLAANDNAANGSTTFADQSSLGLTLGAKGNAQYSNAQAPAGMTTSMALDGNDWVNLPADANLTLSGDFTIEAFVRLNGNDGDSMLMGLNFAVRNVQCRLNSPSTGHIYMYDSGNAAGTTSAGSSWSNTWRHTAISRSGSNVTFWQDGAKVGNTVTSSATFDFSSQDIGAYISDANTYAGTGLNGWIASLRVTKGVGRYTANFTPPALPLPTRA